MFIFRGTHVGQQRNEESVITCQIMPNDHGSLLDSEVNMQLASPNPLVIKVFFGQGFLGHPFKMHFDFRPLLRRTFAKISPPVDPSFWHMYIYIFIYMYTYVCIYYNYIYLYYNYIYPYIILILQYSMLMDLSLSSPMTLTAGWIWSVSRRLITLLRHQFGDAKHVRSRNWEDFELKDIDEMNWNESSPFQIHF